jgi:hypothetical protein
MSPKQVPNLKVNPFVERLLEAREAGPVYVTRGYVGAVDDQSVRLYLDLELETYADIPRDAVIEASQIEDSRYERAELVVDGSHDIRLVHTNRQILTPSQIADLTETARMQNQVAHDPCQPVPDPCDCSPGSNALRPAGANRQIAGGPAMAQAAHQEAQRRRHDGDEDTGPDPLRVVGRVASAPFRWLGRLF